MPDALSKSSNPAGRRATVEVDTTRLLTRVTRAFAAAREREGEIRLRLSPPELGSLRLDVRVQDGALVARLQTETDAARTAILENLSTLRDRLSEQGVRIERFDVDLMQRQPGGMPDQPGGRQQDFPTSPLRVAPPPRARPESSSTVSPTQSVASPSDGLNVIV
jgi:flagellar hook-length control protein FliK